MKSLITLFGPVVIFAIYSCSPERPVTTKQQLNVPQEFGNYWFQGKAELTSYRLEQARYGEVHPGHAAMIFVTEDFSAARQVKLDDPGNAGDDAWKVLKLNATRKFNTGVYPYSMMASTFIPLDFKDPSLMKATVSSQEWCGHTFTQVNRDLNQLQVLLRSYFESEGDRNFNLERSLLEDEIWSIIRLDPNLLPVGNISIVPSFFYNRLSHRPIQVEKATAQLDKADSLVTYSISYAEFERNLSVTFTRDFPHHIEGWEETYKSGFGNNAKTLTTKAVKDKSIMLDYWSKNSLADSVWREKLNLL